MDWLFKKFISIYSIWPMILTVGVGAFALLNDSPNLKSKKKLKEAKWARRVGLIYVIGGLGLFILIKALD